VKNNSKEHIIIGNRSVLPMSVVVLVIVEFQKPANMCNDLWMVGFLELTLIGKLVTLLTLNSRYSPNQHPFIESWRWDNF
jgi:hypothetical protein